MDLTTAAAAAVVMAEPIQLHPATVLALVALCLSITHKD
jgi:hypothetical protein